jgi:putative ABC transport system ATP-binding protein
MPLSVVLHTRLTLPIHPIHISALTWEGSHPHDSHDLKRQALLPLSWEKVVQDSRGHFTRIPERLNLESLSSTNPFGDDPNVIKGNPRCSRTLSEPHADRTMPEPLIIAEKLTRVYTMGSREVIGIRDVDLRIAAGELVVLKGDSGAGKSTLLALLAGLDQPSRGRLRVAGEDLHQATAQQLNRYRREVSGIIFQSFNLLPTLTVLENVCLPALLAGRPYHEVKEESLEYLEWLKLTERLQHYPSQLSGGEMQRAAIVRSFINHPSIILADEPTGNLDSHNGEIVIQLLAEINRRSGRTIIIATHSNFADPYASMQICLRDGMISETV